MPIQVLEIQPPHVKNKRFTAILNGGRLFSFGVERGHTYIDHHDTTKRDNYRKRHFISSRQRPLLEHLTPSPSVLAFYILWGQSTSLETNVEYLNRLWQKIH